MNDFKALTDTELLELLATYTTRYTTNLQINSDSTGQREYKKIIDDLVAEMCERKSQTYSKAELSHASQN